MKLFLASEAKHPDSLTKLLDFIGGSFANKTIAYIPTAANGEFFGSWKNGQSFKIASELGAKIIIIELESFVYQDIYQPIKSADIIWMAGGMTGYLLYWLRRTELDKLLPEVLNQGTIYVGSSAGSMVCSVTQYVNDIYIDESEPGASLLPGLGLVDFEIYPHFEDSMLPQIQKSWTYDIPLYLLKNGEAITITDGNLQVLGEKRILKGDNQ